MKRIATMIFLLTGATQAFGATASYPDMLTCLQTKLGKDNMAAHGSPNASPQALLALNNAEGQYQWRADMSAATKQCKAEMCVKDASGNPPKFYFCKPPVPKK
jgi:hypothetical protein